jgi:tRNA threonylcarbamoyladenosine biosynthesis protein TsaE
MQYALSMPAGRVADWLQNVPDETAVADLAGSFARSVRPPLVIFLQGDLGAGKTTFARALIRALGYEGYVKSPTYGLLESYQVGGLNILHLDLYRIEDPEELDFLALRDLFDDRTLLLVEWPDRGLYHLPEPDLLLNFEETAETRTIACYELSEPGRELGGKVKSDL